MSFVPVTRHTLDEYFAMDEASEPKLEFIDGEVIAMSGGTERHSLLGVNASSALRAILRPHGCRVHSSDQRVHAETTGAFMYPDVVVVCDRHVPGPPRTFQNPSVLVEVLSPSTQNHDRGKKLLHYQQIPSLSDMLLICSWQIRVDHFRRVAPNRWEQTIYVSIEETIELSLHGARLPVAELYDQFEIYEGISEDDGGERP